MGEKTIHARHRGAESIAWAVLALAILSTLFWFAPAESFLPVSPRMPPAAIASQSAVRVPESAALPPTQSQPRISTGPREGLAPSALLSGFLENKGQVDGPVAFYRRTGRQTLWLTPGAVVFDLRRGGTEPVPKARLAERQARGPGERLVFSQEFVGANPRASIEPRELLPGVHNYFLGNDPARWRTGVRAWNAVVYREAWNGIDVVMQGTGRHLEQEFVVRPGADPGRIRIAYHGIEDLRIAEDGSLVIRTAFGELREHAPTIYQEIDGQRVAVSGRFRLVGTTSYAFEIGPYERRYALVIDPTLIYSTYLGGSGDDGVFSAFSVDAAGAAYLAGSTDSLDFPPPSPPQPLPGGLRDSFVVKLNPAGTALVFATYIGGNGQDDATSARIDNSGNVYVAGTTTSTNFPVQAALQPALAGPRDAFVMKLNAAGSAIVYSTYLGGTGVEFAQASYINPDSGELTIVGDTSSADFPVTAGAFQTDYAGGPFDGFVARLNAAGSAVAFATYLGGSGEDSAKAVKVDATGIYVAGSTTSATDFPIASALQPTFGGGIDGFVTKLTPAGSSLLYSTYLGGGGDDAVYDMVVDGTAHALVTGVTSSTDFPLLNAIQLVYGGGDSDAFVARIAPSGAGLASSTYLGGGGHDEGDGIALDSADNMHVVGITSSTNFPTLNALQPTYGGGPSDGFVTMLTINGQRLSSTFLGGTGEDDIVAIAIDGLDAVYVAGRTNTPNLPTTGGPAFAGVFDAVVMKISPVRTDLSVAVVATPSPVLTGTNLTYTITIANAGPDTAVGVGLFDTMQAGTTFQSVTPSASCMTPGVGGTGPVGCSVGTLASGASTVLTLVVRVTAPSGSVSNTASVSSATPDPVAGNNDTTTVTNVTAPGAISGTVTQGAGGPNPGAPIVGALVIVRNSDSGGQVATGLTDGSGNFNIGNLPPRSYEVSAEADGFVIRYFNNQTSISTANPVIVNSGATTGGINFALPGGTGGLRGRVTLTDGVTPVVGAAISIRFANGNGVLYTASTDANGDYDSRRRLSPGSYIVRVTATSFPVTYYVDGKSVASATQVPVALDQDTTGVDVRLSGAVGGFRGTVTSAGTGQPLAGAGINVYEGANGSFIQGYTANSAGQYNTGLTLAPGQYKVTAVVAGSETMAYNNKFSIAAGDPVTVTNGAITSGIDIAVPLLGGITGVVLNAATGTPLQGAIVDVNDFAANTFVVSATTAADGTYTINNLNPFQGYRVRARLANFGLVFHANKPSAGAADLVTVPPGATTTVNFSLGAGGGITGTVTDAATATVLQGVSIDIIDGASTNPSINNFMNFAVTTNASGNFNTGRVVPPGVYKIRARRLNSGYIQTFHPAGLDLSTAATVVVTAGADTPNVNVAMSLGGTITGTILDRASGLPLSGATVIARRLRSSSFFGDFTVTTNANGAYTIMGLHPGEWLITAQAAGHVLGWYSGDPDNLGIDFSTALPVQIVGAETVAGVDLNLELGGGQIRGRVTRADNGQPAPTGTFVAIRGPWPRTSSVSPASVQTTVQGDYSFSGLPPGRYIVEADRVQVANGTAIGFFPLGATSRASGLPITVTDGGVVTADFQVIGFSGGATPRSIGGTLRDASNNPVREAQIFLFEPTGNSFVRAINVFHDGSFAMDGLVPGRYLLEALTERTFVHTYFPAELTANTATPIDVTGGNVAGINIVMAGNPATITGTITRSDTGEPIQGAGISIRTLADTAPSGANAEANGTYLVRGLAPGTYRIRVSAPGFVTKYYKVGAPEGVATAEEGSFLTVTGGTNTPNIDVALDPTGGALTGTVRSQDTLQPLVGALAVIHDAVTRNRVTVVSTNAAGVWRSEGLGPGTYKIALADIQDARFATQWYSGEGSLLTADPVAVAAVGVTGGVDVLVSTTRGAISGKIFLSDSQTPLANAAIDIIDAVTGGIVRRSVSGSTGVWRAEGLAPGSNRYVARARALGYADQFFPFAAARSGATPITVVNGGDTPNINFSMTLSSDITGRVSYGGDQVGALVVRLFTGAGFTQQAYETVIPAPNFAAGQVYGFMEPAPDTRGLFPGSYQIRAFVDTNGNRTQDSTEAFGSFVTAVPVTEAVIRSGTDFALSDPVATNNSSPVANAQEVNVVQGTSDNTIVLTGEDAETATANLGYTVASSPLNGALTTTADPQRVLYTPNPGFTGPDSFTFMVTDRGDPDACGPPSPTCAATLTSSPATVTIQVAANVGTTTSAQGNPDIPVNSTGFTLGNVRIAENAVGVLAPGSAITLTLPVGLSFRGTPTVSLEPPFYGAAPNLLPVNPDPADFATAISFTLSTASTTGRASILVSNMKVAVSPTFLEADVASAAVFITVSGPNPGVTPKSVQNATVVAPAAGPKITTVAPDTAARGATDRPVVITGANFAANAVASFGPNVAVGITFNSPTRIEATLGVGAAAALGVRDLVVTNPGTGQSATLAGAFEITDVPAVLTASGPLTQGLDNQQVTITGTGFGSPTVTPSNLLVGVNGGSITVTEVGYTNATTITAKVNVPANAAVGNYDVTVINPDGGTATGLGLLRIADEGLPAPPSGNPAPPPPPPPVIGSLSTASGPIGSTVTINGSNFGSTPSVSFAGANGTRVTAAVSGGSSSSVTATVPSGATTGLVTVTAGSLVSTGVAFSVTTPVLAAVIPNAITADAVGVKQVQLILSGSRFVLGASVNFSGPAGDIALVGGATVSPDGSTLTQTVSVPAALQVPGPRNVTVTNPGACGQAPAGCLSSTLTAGIQIQPAPAATFTITLPEFADDSTYLPSVTNVSLARVASGACTPATKVVTPTGVQLRAQFVSSTGLTPPASVTFSLASSALRGTATNEDCELDPANPTPDFSVGQSAPTSQQVVVQHAGGGLYQTTLFSHDWGGKVTVTVTGTTGQVTATASRLFPVDADGDDLPDAYEKNAALNAGPTGANALSFQNSDQNGNTVKDRDDRFARDGLSNFEKYRGVYRVGPTPGASGALTGHQRLGAGKRNLFVRGRGFRDDPAVPAGACGINPTTGAPVADATLSPTNPCPALQVGGAFAEIGVAVQNVSASFTATTELLRVSLVTPTQKTLDMATVVYDGVNCKGAEACSTISKFGVRQWGNATLGYTTPNGTATTYGAATVYKRAIECYFNCKPYEHRTNDPSKVVAAPDGTAMLAPITLVGDSSVSGRDNGRADAGELTINGVLAGDAYIAGSFTQQLSALDINSDSCIELPTAADPTTIARCSPAADTAPAPSATKQQVVRTIVTHELGHVVGVATHTSDATDVMYLSTINFTRDGHFSPTAAGLVQIHNKGLQ